MPTKKYFINENQENSLARMKEVQFYLFLQAFFYKYNYNNQYIAQLIESLAQLFDCSPTRISVLIANFNSPIYKPTRYEIVLTAAHLKIPVRTISKITGMSMETYYKNLRNYIQSKEPLTARLEPEYTADMDKFLQNALIMFEEISDTLKGYANL